VKALLSGWREDIERRPGLGSCTLDLAGRLPRVSADGKYLGRVFENLASNAERYAPKSDIELSARVRRAGRRTEVVIGFADHGPGIHPEDIEIIFEPFKDPSQYRDQTAEHGFGFGLYYCRKVMEAHQSAIWVESRLGHGATFYLALPAST
jgi:signal transduction histidine kinase